MSETPKQIAARIKRGDYRPMFRREVEAPGPNGQVIVITGGRTVARVAA